MVRNFVDEGHFIVQLVRGEYVVVNTNNLLNDPLNVNAGFHGLPVFAPF